MRKKKYLFTAMAALLIALFAFAPVNTYAAKTKNVYVVSKVKRTVKGYKYGRYQVPGGGKSQTINYSYNKSGLIKKSSAKDQLTQKFTYDNKNRLSVYEWNDMTYDGFKYDAKGRVKKDPAYGNMKYNSKNQLKSRKLTYGDSYGYAYSNGLVKRMVYNGSEKTFYTYDSKKNLVNLQKNGEYENIDIDYANTYKSGRLSKRVATETIKNEYEDGEEVAVTTFTYTYKKIKVPASLVSRINAQQRWVLSGSLEYDDYDIPLSAVY